MPRLAQSPPGAGQELICIRSASYISSSRELGSHQDSYRSDLSEPEHFTAPSTLPMDFASWAVLRPTHEEGVQSPVPANESATRECTLNLAEEMDESRSAPGKVTSPVTEVDSGHIGSGNIEKDGMSDYEALDPADKRIQEELVTLPLDGQTVVSNSLATNSATEKDSGTLASDDQSRTTASMNMTGRDQKSRTEVADEGRKDSTSKVMNLKPEQRSGTSPLADHSKATDSPVRRSPEKKSWADMVEEEEEERLRTAVEGLDSDEGQIDQAPFHLNSTTELHEAVRNGEHIGRDKGDLRTMFQDIISPSTNRGSGVGSRGPSEKREGQSSLEEDSHRQIRPDYKDDGGKPKGFTSKKQWPPRRTRASYVKAPDGLTAETLYDPFQERKRASTLHTRVPSFGPVRSTQSPTLSRPGPALGASLGGKPQTSPNKNRSDNVKELEQPVSSSPSEQIETVSDKKKIFKATRRQRSHDWPASELNIESPIPNAIGSISTEGGGSQENENNLGTSTISDTTHRTTEQVRPPTWADLVRGITPKQPKQVGSSWSRIESRQRNAPPPQTARPVTPSSSHPATSSRKSLVDDTWGLIGQQNKSSALDNEQSQSSSAPVEQARSEGVQEPSSKKVAAANSKDTSQFAVEKHSVKRNKEDVTADIWKEFNFHASTEEKATSIRRPGASYASIVRGEHLLRPQTVTSPLSPPISASSQSSSLRGYVTAPQTPPGAIEADEVSIGSSNDKFYLAKESLSGSSDRYLGNDPTESPSISAAAGGSSSSRDPTENKVQPARRRDFNRGRTHARQRSAVETLTETAFGPVGSGNTNIATIAPNTAETSTSSMEESQLPPGLLHRQHQQQQQPPPITNQPNNPSGIVVSAPSPTTPRAVENNPPTQSSGDNDHGPRMMNNPCRQFVIETATEMLTQSCERCEPDRGEH